jgi:hypothetical protein
MDWRRSFASVVIPAALAAGAADAIMATAPTPSGAAIPMPPGWQMRDYDPDSSWIRLTMSHPLGDDRLEFSFDVTGHDAAPETGPTYLVESHFEGQNCLFEDLGDVGNVPVAERARLTHALVERALAAIRPDCFAPGRRAELLEGFDAAYAALVTRAERLRPRLDAAADSMASMEANMTMDTNMTWDDAATNGDATAMNMDMDTTSPPPQGSEAR